ncbi:transposase [Pseudomonas syringae]|uniref:transposase n=1 Tax=Pseudomonas syringae TaxID=317 RepID=UPI00200B668D|nr:transposase [Pseudomonas syringae]MCK9744165.1 transposase [Pseudomonas syringae pv. syringae]MCK9769642.1 transposase [Pseudomonas syringae pv. syringae]
MRHRSSYPKTFKAQVVQKCLQPLASISSVAINHGINANVIFNWVPLYLDQPAGTSLTAFVPLKPHLNGQPKRQ